MFLKHHFQNAYVTADIDRAVALLQAQLGAPDDAVRLQLTQQVWTPAGPGESVVKVALLQLGSLQYEIVEPVAGACQLYRDFVNPARPLSFHHIGMRADDLDAVCRESEKQGRKLVYSGENTGIRFAYFDARDTLGHYLEYIQAPAAFWEMLAQRAR